MDNKAISVKINRYSGEKKIILKNSYAKIRKQDFQMIYRIYNYFSIHLLDSDLCLTVENGLAIKETKIITQYKMHTRQMSVFI